MPRVQQAFWFRVKSLTAVLLLIWAAVSFVGPWFAAAIDQAISSRHSVSYWMASQGALALFIALVGVYIWGIERLEAKYLAELRSSSAPSVDAAASLSPIDRPPR